jgi:hypothetical protein
MSFTLPDSLQYTPGDVWGEIDMIVSPKDGQLVVVPKNEQGLHFCHRCTEVFIPGHPKKGGVEVTFGGTRILLHPDCVEGMPLEKRIFRAISLHQMRRRFTRAVKGSAAVDAAAAENKNKIVA